MTPYDARGPIHQSHPDTTQHNTRTHHIRALHRSVCAGERGWCERSRSPYAHTHTHTHTRHRHRHDHDAAAAAAACQSLARSPTATTADSWRPIAARDAMVRHMTSHDITWCHLVLVRERPVAVARDGPRRRGLGARSVVERRRLVWVRCGLGSYRARARARGGGGPSVF